jgi:hypothetical protein
VELLVSLLVVVIVICLVLYITERMPLPEPWGTVVRIVVCLILLLWVLSRFGVLG